MGLTVHFDTAFDGGGWPGPSGSVENAIGVLWVGPLDLLGRLEVELGLTGPATSPAVRAARLMKRMENTAGYWSASFEHDGLGTAQRLLTERDELVAWGWDPRDKSHRVSPRLTQLAEVTSEVDPGSIDRLRDVHEALDKRGTQIERITLYTGRTTLPTLWRRVLDKLQAQHVAIEEPQELHSQATGDLRGALEPDFHPQGDGSLQLVRPYGPLKAAEDVAARIASHSSPKDFILVGPDPVLDAALGRHSLPVTGQPRPAGGLGSVVPLAIELGWTPQDPAVANQLLALAAGPIPRSVAWHLRKALAEWPSLESPTFAERFEKALSKIEDADRRASIEDHVTSLLAPLAERSTDAYPVDALDLRLDTLEQWAQARLHAGGDDAHPNDTAGLHQVLQHCEPRRCASAYAATSSPRATSPAPNAWPRPVWKRTSWTDLDQDEYFEIIESFRECGLDKTRFWEIERYWNPEG